LLIVVFIVPDLRYIIAKVVLSENFDAVLSNYLKALKNLLAEALLCMVA